GAGAGGGNGGGGGHEAGGVVYDLFIGRDAALVEEAARRYDSPRVEDAVERVGELLGYPACCRRAFAALEDRGDNTAVRLATAARTTGAYDWLLNNSCVNLAPFYPCRYDCPEAARFARAVFDRLAEISPAYAARLRDMLRRPVLFFDAWRRLVFRGARLSPEGLRYARVEPDPQTPGAGAPPSDLGFARAMQEHFINEVWPIFAGADQVHHDGAAFVLSRGGREVAVLRRIAAGAGVLMPFGLDGEEGA
ncbi:MAG: hypothetical protein HY719_04415, partial [Planctomycetes bacterium]|nr:hypothetical protein [Planctomycetota bacterium]